MYQNPYVDTKKSLCFYWESHADTPVTPRTLSGTHRIRARETGYMKPEDLKGGRPS